MCSYFNFNLPFFRDVCCSLKLICRSEPRLIKGNSFRRSSLKIIIFSFFGWYILLGRGKSLFVVAKKLLCGKFLCGSWQNWIILLKSKLRNFLIWSRIKFNNFLVNIRLLLYVLLDLFLSFIWQSTLFCHSFFRQQSWNVFLHLIF